MSDDLKLKLFTDYERDMLYSIKSEISNLIHTKLKYMSPQFTSFVVAGGCFASCINDPASEYNDVDIFVMEDEHPTIKVMKKDPKFVELTTNGDYKGNPNIVAVFNDTETKLQYIFTKHKNRQEVVNNFDFLHCMISYSYGQDKMFLTRQSFEAASRKLLIPNLPKEKISQKRWQKFRDRGYREVNSI